VLGGLFKFSLFLMVLLSSNWAEILQNVLLITLPLPTLLFLSYISVAFMSLALSLATESPLNLFHGIHHISPLIKTVLLCWITILLLPGWQFWGATLTLKLGYLVFNHTRRNSK
jgi:hypothetical protein